MTDLLAFGRFGRAHGVRGEIRFWPYNTDTALIARGRTARIGLEADDVRAYVVGNVKRDAKGWVVRLEGVDDRDVAMALNGSSWFVERSEFPAAGAEEFYLVDLFGKPVRTDDGRAIGTLVDFMDGPAGELLVIEGDGRRHLVPNIDQFVVTLNPDAEAVVIRPVPGLIDGLDDG